MSNLNGFELAGRNMKVNHVTERDTSAMETLDGEDTDGGVGMTPQSRAALMARLAEGHNTGGWLVPILGECYFLHCLSPLSLSLFLSFPPPPGLTVPQLPQVNVPNIPVISSCFMLSNMFDPSHENDPGWDKDINDDVLEECMRHGPVMHIYVDPFSQVRNCIKLNWWYKLSTEIDHRERCVQVSICCGEYVVRYA